MEEPPPLPEPQTVSAGRLQHANALQGLTRNVTRVLGPLVGAASFVACALILLRIRIRRASAGRSAKSDLGGAGAWGAILAASGVGSVAGGFFALRFRPERPLAASVAFSTLPALQFAALAAGPPVWVIAAASFVGGVGLAVHLALWFTVFQQQVPEHAQSRVSSYDSLGSIVLIPIGFALVGPLAEAVGVRTALWGAGAFDLACCLGVLVLPSVWAIRAKPEAAAEASALPEPTGLAAEAVEHPLGGSHRFPDPVELAPPPAGGDVRDQPVADEAP